MSPVIKLNDNGDGTWTATVDGIATAHITLAAMSNGALSVDVHPAGPSKVDAIAFGAKPVIKDGPRNDRFTLGPHNGTIKQTSEPFVCVAIYPKKGK